jgi:hypothetical protein
MQPARRRYNHGRPRRYTSYAVAIPKRRSVYVVLGRADPLYREAERMWLSRLLDTPPVQPRPRPAEHYTISSSPPPAQQQPQPAEWHTLHSTPPPAQQQPAECYTISLSPPPAQQQSAQRQSQPAEWHTLYSTPPSAKPRLQTPSTALELWRKTAQGNSGMATRASLTTSPLLLRVTKKFDRTIKFTISLPFALFSSHCNDHKSNEFILCSV